MPFAGAGTESLVVVSMAGGGLSLVGYEGREGMLEEREEEDGKVGSVRQDLELRGER